MQVAFKARYQVSSPGEQEDIDRRENGYRPELWNPPKLKDRQMWKKRAKEPEKEEPPR